MAKIGDTVRFLNSIGGGRIVRIEGNIAHVEDSDGFDVPVLLKECVVVMEAPKGGKVDLSPETTSKSNTPSTNAPTASYRDETITDEKKIEVEETPGGDKLNIVIAFEPVDIKRLSTTRFEVTLVNDSNYFLDFTFSSRNSDEKEWTLRKADVVEPNIMLSLTSFGNEDLNDYSKILFQCIAYKKGKKYDAKTPFSVEYRIDTTKFCRLHCFKENPYFDEPVIACNIATDDIPYSPVNIAAESLEDELKKKKAVDRPVARPVKKHPRKKNETIEVDLHINELVDNTHGLSRADMINLQIDEFRKVMDANIKNHGQKIVFIHGKGEGVLRQALLKELSHRYKGHDVCDASFREYGFGATQVTIK